MTSEIDPVSLLQDRTQSAAPLISLEDISVTFPLAGGTLTAVENIDLSAGRGEFITLVGPSGCGKSTLLNVLAGLLQPSGGQAKIRGNPVGGQDKELGYLFQNDVLLPWKTAVQNVMLPLIFRGVEKAEATSRAMEWLERVGLGGFAHHYPAQLSGGMRKRVALAAVFIFDPNILLMDEPFGALDVQTRNLMENELLDIWNVRRPLVLFVTHDLEEAIGLADRVVVFTSRPGRIKREHRIDLPRPRELNEIRFDRKFQDIYKEIWGDLRDEVVHTYKQETR